MLNLASVLGLKWLGKQPKTTEPPRKEGLEIKIRGAEAHLNLDLTSGARLALVGHDTYKKHFFCDWLLGFVNVPGAEVTMQLGSRLIEQAGERAQCAALLGRSPLLYGETLQESLLYRTQNVRKQELYDLIERHYGPSLRARTSPQNPLLDPNGKPVPIRMLNAREHIEIAQINFLLQKVQLLILDLSSELMTEAMAQGFRPAAELIEGKTVICILPPGKEAVWGEKILGRRFTARLEP